MFGTYLLVFLGSGSVVIASMLHLTLIETLFVVATVFGGTVGTMILLLGRHSGAHINPAISVGSTLAGLLRRELFIPYIFFQAAGGLLAGLSLKVAFSAVSATNLGSTELASGITPTEGIILEVAGTFVLALSAFTAASFVDNPKQQALLVGGTLFTLILLIGPLTGASFNPARSLGPSLFSGYFTSQLIYYVGPAVGAASAGLIFRVLKRRYDNNNNNKRKGIVCLC